MIVADTNLICYLYFETPYSELATRVHEKDPEWAAPLLWRSEFNQVLATYLRKKLLDFADALEVADYAQRTIGGREFSVTHQRVLDLVNQSSCSAYDCEFVALATDLQAKLLTFDQQVLREFPRIAIHPEEFIKTVA